MSLIEGPLANAVNGHHPDGTVIQNQWYGANGAGLTLRLKTEVPRFLGELVPNQLWLAGSYNLFNHVVPGSPQALRQSNPVHDFDFESYLLGLMIVKCDEKAAHIEEFAHLRIDALE